MEQEQTGGTGTGHREVQLRRTAHGEFDVENVRGGRIHIGTGEGADFTPVELLLAAIERFEVLSEGVKVRDERGNHLDDIAVTFTVTFPEGEAGDRAREMLPKSIQMSHDRLCTVSRTVLLGTPIAMRAVD